MIILYNIKDLTHNVEFYIDPIDIIFHCIFFYTKTNQKYNYN